MRIPFLAVCSPVSLFFLSPPFLSTIKWNHSDSGDVPCERFISARGPLDVVFEDGVSLRKTLFEPQCPGENLILMTPRSRKKRGEIYDALSMQRLSLVYTLHFVGHDCKVTSRIPPFFREIFLPSKMDRRRRNARQFLTVSGDTYLTLEMHFLFYRKSHIDNIRPYVSLSSSKVRGGRTKWRNERSGETVYTFTDERVSVSSACL